MKNTIYLILGLIALLMPSCSSNNLYDDLPRQVQHFVSEYYPGNAIESFSSTKDSYTVIVKDGPTIIFNASCQWTSINGNGSTLPQVFLFNDCPPDLYSYLQETQNTDNVFSVTRNSSEYVLTLLNQSITYQIESGKISGSDAGD